MPYLRTDFSAFSDPTSNRADFIAAELDQRRIGEGLQTWVVHVFGVHDDGREGLRERSGPVVEVGTGGRERLAHGCAEP